MGFINTLTKVKNGLAANDGTGQTLRSGADTINGNWDAIVTAINSLAASQGSGVKPFATKADLVAAQSTLPVGTVAVVFDDDTPANNTSYVWDGTTLTEGYDRLTYALGDGSGFVQNGTGAVLRTFLDKARDVVDLMDFYAIGDGDDRLPAFNRAFAYCTSIGGLELRLPFAPPSNPLWVSGTLVYPNNIRIVGKGWRNTCIKLMASKNVTVMESSSWAANTGTTNNVDFTADLIDFQVDGNRANNTSAGDGIHFYGHSCQWRGIRVLNTYGQGINTEYGTAGGPSGGLEAGFYDITTDTTGADGWYYNGPHDSYIAKVHCIDSWLNDTASTNTTPGTGTGAAFTTTAKAAGCRYLDIHPWKRGTTVPRPLYSIIIAAGVLSHFTAEGGHNGLLLENGSRAIGGDAYGTSPACATLTFGTGGNCEAIGVNLNNNRATSCVAMRFTSNKHVADVSAANYTGALIDNQIGSDLVRSDLKIRAYNCTELLDASATVFFDSSTNVVVRGDGTSALNLRYDSPGAGTFSGGGTDSTDGVQLTLPFCRVTAAGSYLAMRLQFGQQQKIVNRTSGSITIYPWSSSAGFTSPYTGVNLSLNAPVTLGAYCLLTLTGYSSGQSYAHVTPLATAPTT